MFCYRLSRLPVCRLLALLLLNALYMIPAYAQDQNNNERPPTRFQGYPNAPEVSVVPRKDQLSFYPCAACHSVMKPNPEIRELNVPHNAKIAHGQGRIWCLSCHHLDERNYLRTLLNEPVDFDDAHLVCSGCHANRHRDWAFGVHGKRVAHWQGERTIYSCVHCHNPHDPAIKPRAPKPPPPVRVGLERDPGQFHERLRLWEQRQRQREGQ